MTYEIIRNKNLFATHGLMSIIGAELEVELDWLTAERVGEKAAKVIFDLFIEATKGIDLKDGVVIEDFNLSNKKSIRQEGELWTLSERKVRLVQKDLLYRLVLSDVRGRWLE